VAQKFTKSILKTIFLCEEAYKEWV